MLWIAYILSILLTWYENRWIVGQWPITRPLWYSRSNQGRLFIVRVVLVYVTLMLIWYEYRFIIALIAFAAYWAFSKITFRMYFRREVLQTARQMFDMAKEQCAQGNQPFDADEQWRQSLNRARSMVLSNMSGKRLGEL